MSMSMSLMFSMMAFSRFELQGLLNEGDGEAEAGVRCRARWNQMEMEKEQYILVRWGGVEWVGGVSLIDRLMR